MQEPTFDSLFDRGSLKCKVCGDLFESRRRLSGHIVGKHIRRLGLSNSHVQTRHLTDSQKGYIAAFLDGEGGIQITMNRRKSREYSLALHPCVYFTNTNQRVIRTIRGWLGAGCVTCRRSASPFHKDTYALSVTGTRNVLELHTVLQPHLIVKRKQADVMMAYCKSRLGHYRAGDRRFNAKELALYTKLKRFNMKGGKNRRQPMDR